MYSIQAEFKQTIELLNNKLKLYIEGLEAPKNLKEAMGYSLQAGGKRIRPMLLFSTLSAFQEDLLKGLPVASAIEMIHTYSLIHDDLPAMDNDDLRRGKPTNHKVYGEATAILAGDALLTYSFQAVAEMNDIAPEIKVRLMQELAKAAGPEGMVGGQIADMEGENQSLSLEQLEYIHTHKTGKLLMFSVKAGAILSQANPEIERELERFAYHIGLAFQIRDDILDIEGTSDVIGKNSGSDLEKQKSTYPSLLTLSGAKEKLQEHVQTAETILKNLPMDTKQLELVAEWIGKRDH